MSWEDPEITEHREGEGLAQVGTALFLVITILVFVCYLAIFINPTIPLNPFPPVTVMVEIPTRSIATTTAVAAFTPSPTFPPTWTPTATPTWTATVTPSPTPTPVPPTNTPTPLPPFSLRADPIHTEQLLYPGATGWWSGLAGEVSDRDGNPVTDVQIKIWDDSGHVWQVTPGDASRYTEQYGTAYGGGGTYAWWEQVLEASCQQVIPVHVQVIRNGEAVTGVVDVETSGDCKKNLILIYFQKND